MATKKEKERAEYQRGLEAGEMLRFFLNGGNDTKWADPQQAEQGAMCAVSHMLHMLTENEAKGFLAGSGFVQVRSATGGTLIVPGTQSINAQFDRILKGE